VDLRDFIARPFPEKQSPPSEIILSQQGAIIKKRNSLFADYAEIEILFISILLPILGASFFQKTFWRVGEGEKRAGGISG
jgi:hypothetical protein